MILKTMIEIIIKDKNGRELANGDTVKFLSIQPDMQKERGDNIPFGGFFEHQVGTIIEFTEEVFDAQKEMDEYGFVSSPNDMALDRSDLCQLFGLPNSIEDDEFNECVLDYVSDEIKIKLTLDQLLNLVNDFEIL